MADPLIPVRPYQGFFICPPAACQDVSAPAGRGGLSGKAGTIHKDGWLRFAQI
jgi:hypothetical protein